MRVRDRARVCVRVCVVFGFVFVFVFLFVHVLMNFSALVRAGAVVGVRLCGSKDGRR